MDYVRISLMTPRAGQSHEATRLLSQIIALCSQQRGFRGGMIVGGRPGAGRVIGRMTVWDDRASADRVSGTEHMLALRSQLMQLVDADSHTEYALDAVTLSAEPGGSPALTPSEAVRIAEGVVREPRRIAS